MDLTHLPYRPCVGVMLINREGLVFIGDRRKDATPEHVSGGYSWQMPQGGIDADEDPAEAARRELAEETGVTSALLLAETPEWLAYDLPAHVALQSWKGRYRGQKQKWFAFRFEGQDTEINILAPPGGHKPEFEAWRWEKAANLPGLIIPFKRPIYKQVVRIFAPYCA
jgi:putative (di)nucleoside polyphosphate hydrolase